MKSKNMMTLDDVLNEFVTAFDHPTAQGLEEWVERYPQYRHELVEFAATWAEQLVFPPAQELGEDIEKSLIERTMSHVLNVAYQREEKTSDAQDNKPIQNLTKEAQRTGMTVQEFAKSCVLDLLLVSKLNNRQIDPQTIPRSLIKHIAGLINKSFSVVADYVALPPLALANKSFLSRDKPADLGRQSFADAVRASSLSETEKAQWLEKDPNQDDG